MRDCIKFKMAKRSVSFYGELNRLSTADFLSFPKRRNGSGPLYDVERIVSRKICKGQAEYLVKWKGYGSLSNSWEPEENLNTQALRAYWNPKPDPELISSGADALHAAILENLMSKSISPTILCFRHDVFQYLFKDKWTKSADGKHMMLNKRDFLRCSFPPAWDMLIDKLGDGVKVEFPIKVRLFISESPKSHTVIGGKITPLPRYNIEKISLNCMKEAASLTSN